METTHSLSSRSLQYYVMAKHWAADLEFFKLETSFFHRLLDEYMISLSSNQYAEKLKIVGKKLLKLESDERNLNVLLDEQIKHLELMAEDVIPEDTETLASQQVQLENLTARLMREYRDVKKQLFHLVESGINKTPVLF